MKAACENCLSPRSETDRLVEPSLLGCVTRGAKAAEQARLYGDKRSALSYLGRGYALMTTAG